LEAALLRLKDSTEAANAGGDKPYQIGFSIGAATIEPTSDESFAELVDRADAAMYQEKRQRHAASETGVLPNEFAAANTDSRRG